MARNKSTRARVCTLCGQPMRKKGFTSAGRQRWQCDRCHASTVMSREDARYMADFLRFYRWITSRHTLTEDAAAAGLTQRGFMHRVAWCWNVTPRIPADGVVHSYIQVDGTYLPHGWCLLVAAGEDGLPVAWQWCDKENKAAYLKLFHQIPRPDGVVCDGNESCLDAARMHWKNIPIQRCLVHVQRDMIRDLSRNPKTEAGKSLLKLTNQLMRVHSIDQARDWLVNFAQWHSQYALFLKERSYAKDHPDSQEAQAGQQWWYTHKNLRRADRRLNRLIGANMLFTWLEHDHWPRTTNQLEGGINAEIKRIQDAHRGLSEEHMKRCCEWTLIKKTRTTDPTRFVTTQHWKHHQPKQTPSPNQPNPQTQIQQPHNDSEDTITYETGFAIRKGWIR